MLENVTAAIGRRTALEMFQVFTRVTEKALHNRLIQAAEGLPTHGPGTNELVTAAVAIFRNEGLVADWTLAPVTTSFAIPRSPKFRSPLMLDTLLPPAGDFAKEVALAEADEAARESRARRQAELDKKAWLDQLQKPSGVSDEVAIQRALKMIEGAVQNRRTEVQVHRFPNVLCTDNGRAINQMESGWSETLTGVPSEIYQLWDRHFREKGYKLRAEIIDFPDGMPGDVAMTLVWGAKS